MPTMYPCSYLQPHMQGRRSQRSNSSLYPHTPTLDVHTQVHLTYKVGQQYGDTGRRKSVDTSCGAIKS